MRVRPEETALTALEVYQVRLDRQDRLDPADLPDLRAGTENLDQWANLAGQVGT